MEPVLKTYLGQYQLLELLGRSAAAVVFRAHQASLNRAVAVKVLLHNLDQSYISRFEREAQAIAALQHRNILPIYDYGQQGDWRYFVMQYVVGGRSLDDLLGGAPMEQAQALHLMTYLLSALEYAHSQGVIHRDVKPANILMPWPDWPLLADFGIARLLGATHQLTPPGQAVGTVAYMAPEVGMQRPIDARADLYSAGIVLYEMLTGEVPFEASTPLAVLTKHIYDPPPPPRSLNPALHPAVEAVVLRAIAKEREDRYQSAGEMSAALLQALKQVERTVAQSWLSNQLSPPTPAARTLRSGYTTRKLAPDPDPPAPAALPLPAPIAALPAVARPGPPPPPRRGALAAPAGPAPAQRPAAPARGRGWIAALGLVVLLGMLVSALAWRGLSGSLARGTDPAAPVRATPANSAVERRATVVTPPVEIPPPAVEIPPPTELPAAVATPVAAPAAPAPAPVDPAPAEVSRRAGQTIVLLEDASWQGGYNLSRGSSRYGGRTATWIYGRATEYGTMRAAFELGDQPLGAALLRIEGMDSEGRPKTPISIAVNGVEIYRGPNPLPDDDFPLESGTWASYSWRFDARLLRPGRNQISISNLAEGAFGGPPFFMLDYAELSYAEG